MLLPQKLFPGNQPSNTIALEKVTPYNLGMLMAMYEPSVCAGGDLSYQLFPTNGAWSMASSWRDAFCPSLMPPPSLGRAR
jgi:threonine/homoserine efflux transporter RhtA